MKQFPFLVVALLGLCGCIHAQTGNVGVKGPKNTASVNITVIPAPTVSLACVPLEVFEGDPVVCTVTVDKAAPAPNGYKFPLINGGVAERLADAVVIPAGATTATFSFTAVIPDPAKLPVAWRPLPMVMHPTALGISSALYNQFLPNTRFISLFYYRFL